MSLYDDIIDIALFFKSKGYSVRYSIPKGPILLMQRDPHTGRNVSIMKFSGDTAKKMIDMARYYRYNEGVKFTDGVKYQVYKKGFL